MPQVSYEQGHLEEVAGPSQHRGKLARLMPRGKTSMVDQTLGGDNEGGKQRAKRKRDRSCHLRMVDNSNLV